MSDADAAPLLLLAVDIGSSSVRCTAYVVPHHRRPNTGSDPAAAPQPLHGAKVPSPPSDIDGRFDPGALEAAARAAVDACLAELPPSAHVDAVGFDCFSMSLVGSDADGRACTPVYSYAERHPATAAHARLLKDNLRRTGRLGATYQRTGAPLHVAYAAPTLARLASEEPNLLAQVDCFQSFTSYLLSRWTERRRVPVSYSEASWTGLFDRHRLVWDEELLETVGLDPARLAPVADYDGGDRGRLLGPALTRRWPQLARARLFLGFGDGATANVGSKCTDRTRIAVTIGTSAALRVVVPRESVSRVPPGLWCYSLDGDHALLGGALTDGGSVHRWLGEVLADAAATPYAGASVGSSSGSSSSPSHGIVVLPFLGSERSPGWNDAATATIHGLTQQTTAADIRAAFLQAVSLRLRAVMELVSPFIDPEARVLASGTALKASPGWKQTMANALGRDIVVEPVAEATSRGVAIMVARALRQRLECGDHGASGGDVNAVPQETLTQGAEVISPEPGSVQAYGAALAAQQRLYDKVLGRSWLAGPEPMEIPPGRGVGGGEWAFWAATMAAAAAVGAACGFFFAAGRRKYLR